MSHRTGLLCYALACFSSLWLGSVALAASDTVYRCGNEYTNEPKPQDLPYCKHLSTSGMVSIPGPQAGNGKQAKPSNVAPRARITSPEQAAREQEARQVLQTELQKANAHLSELQAEYQNGEPEKRAGEHRNHQKYLSRVQELQQAMERTKADINSIQKELARLAPSPGLASSPTP
jgi:hypothetical protein